MWGRASVERGGDGQGEIAQLGNPRCARYVGGKGEKKKKKMGRDDGGEEQESKWKKSAG